VHRVSRILSVLLVLLIAAPSLGAETKRIDKKIKSEANEYAVSLAAEGGELGHAFVVWNKGDEVAKMTTQQVVGFYPGADKNKFEAIFGLSPGKIWDDSKEKPDFVLIVLVNGDAYERARKVFDKWKSNGKYLLGFSDCTTFAAEIGAAIGLNMPNRIFAPYPIDYVKAIAAKN